MYVRARETRLDKFKASGHLLDVALHLEGRVELLEAVFALRDVGEVELLRPLLRVDVALHVHHDAQVVVQHLVAVPAL